jgi:hypothetical protein
MAVTKLEVMVSAFKKEKGNERNPQAHFIEMSFMNKLAESEITVLE